MTVAAFEGQDVWLVAKLRLLLAFVLLYYYSQSSYYRKPIGDLFLYDEAS